ncbi:MAG: DUF2505 domain-containing protein [Acidimicrobiales bacterium]
MRLEVEQRFRHGEDDVAEALADPDFLSSLSRLGTTAHAELLDRRQEGDRIVQRTRYCIAAEMPAAVRRFIDPSRLSWVERSTAEVGSHHAVFDISPDYYASRLHCKGTFDLKPAGDGGSVRVISGELTVRVPLLGGRAEQAVMSGLTDYLEMTATAVDAWLDGRKAPPEAEATSGARGGKPQAEG